MSNTTYKTPAQQLGYDIGQKFRVSRMTDKSAYYCEDMIVELSRDDRSQCPWFTYVSGPKTKNTDQCVKIAINLFELEPVEDGVLGDSQPYTSDFKMVLTKEQAIAMLRKYLENQYGMDSDVNFEIVIEG